MMLTVPVIPGDVRTVTKTARGLPIPRADIPKRLHSVGIDWFTVLALLGFCLIADGTVLIAVGLL